MGVVHLPDALERVIDQQVAAGRAENSTAFLEEAIMRLADEAGAEEAEIFSAVQAGIADIEAGRYRSVLTPADSQREHEHAMERLRLRLAAGE